MSVDLAHRMGIELARRLEVNAQRYDRDTQLYLKSSVRANQPGGWLRNIVAKCFADTDALGSVVLGVVHATGEKMDYCVLGDINILVYRVCENHVCREVFSKCGDRIFHGSISSGHSS